MGTAPDSYREPDSYGEPDETPVAQTGRNILVIANETVAGEALREMIERRARGYDAQIVVVCPALNSRLRHWLSDVDRARAKAAERLDVMLAALADIGLSAEGRVGDAEPLQAIQDALCSFRADEIIISTHPPGRSNWLEKGVVERVRARFELPITHVVVDLERERVSAPDRVPRPDEA